MSPAFEFSVGSGLIYPRRSCRTTACDRARNWIRYSIKQAHANAIGHTVARILEQSEGTELEALLEQTGALVPVPASAPPVKDGLWVSELICEELLHAGVGDQVRPLLTRIRRVQKSSTSSDPGDRPDPTEHAASMACERELLDGKRLTLVDDVVTRGSTMMGCILKLRENYPDIEVQGFALARVEESELQEPSQMLSPKVETVIYSPSATPKLVRR